MQSAYFKSPLSGSQLLSPGSRRNTTYDVPEWITLPVTGGSEPYLSWVVEETSAA